MGNLPDFVIFALEDSVNQAGEDGFTIVQLGARHGVLIRNAYSLRNKCRPDLAIQAIGVEATKDGYSGLISGMSNIGLAVEDHKFLNAGVSDFVGDAEFLLDGAGSRMQTARDMPGAAPEERADDRARELVRMTTVEEILEDVETVDFLEMDIQGMEYRVIEHSIETIQSKVRMICVRTHLIRHDGQRQFKDEADLYQLFKNLGWSATVCIKNRTLLKFGDKTEPLTDGVQCWVNRNLRDTCRHESLPIDMF